MSSKNCVFVLWSLVLFQCSVTAQTSFNTEVTVTEVGKGWSGNSVNTVVFRKNSLASYKNTQFTGYYDADGFVVLGKRNIGENNWQLKRTAYKGNIKDAHNSISIAIDGDGYLHMAWDHHANPLRYAKSKEPLSLELTPMMPMLNKDEQKVTYPEFYKMPNGDLLFFYRDGASGNGNMVLNKYDVQQKQWSRLQTNLIDGENKRNAYWQACVDAKGAIHISWVWRETPDVASNHDMSYAVSKDGGVTWLRSNGQKYVLPVTMATAEKVLTIPPKSELINQTSMSTDAKGNPIIAGYWNDAKGIPQYHVIYKTTKGWAVKDLAFRTTDFSLSGAGTKKIPISRPQIISIESGKTKNAAVIFRDEERGNKVSVAYGELNSKSTWKLVDLLQTNTGSWEPSYDIELWKQQKQLHLFVQDVQQGDGEGVLKVEPQPVRVVEWLPLATKKQAEQIAKKNELLQIIQTVNNYWQKANPVHGRAFWDNAAYHTGNMEAYVLTKDEAYKNYCEAWSVKNQWQGAKSTNKAEWKFNYGEKDEYVLFGDWQICFQTYIDLYNLQPQEEKIARAKEVMNYQVSTSENKYWWWADGLYMVMPVMTKMYKLTGDKIYLDKLYEYYSYANSIMYDDEEKIYYRDAKYVYPKHKSANGKKDFWARGNGWVFAGLAKVLQDLPKDDAHYNEYVEKFKGMAAALKKQQQSEGHWTRSILDTAHAPGYETSGTAFFTYAYLWGMNNGYLNKAEYTSVALKGWGYLKNIAMQPDGKIGYVQPIGERAIPGQVVDKNSTANFGVGAFLLAACEMVRFANVKK
jgi:unsaturated rhamnogalacturonyl hydrolase